MSAPPYPELTYTDACEWFRTYQRNKGWGHVTESFDWPGTRLLGYVDYTDGVWHTIGLAYLKQLSGDHEPEGTQYWKEQAALMKTFVSRREYFLNEQRPATCSKLSLLLG